LTDETAELDILQGPIFQPWIRGRIICGCRE
jgi:hypothetical protein